MLGNTLKKLRESRGLTQQNIATRLGIARGTYASYEINRRSPDLITLKRIAAFYNVSTDFLLNNHTQLSADKQQLLLAIEKLDDTMVKEVESYINYLESQKKLKKNQGSTA